MATVARDVCPEKAIAYYKGLVAKASWAVWRKLPQRTKSWITVDDLIQDGMEWMVMRGIPRWNPSKGNLSTLIYSGVGRYLTDEYAEKFWSKGRREPILVDVTEVEIWDDSEMDSMLRSCWAVSLLVRVYRKASMGLREEMIRWFLKREDGRLRVNTPRFREMSTEFRELANVEKLDVRDCRHVFNSPRCMDELSRHLLWIPYDLDHPTPALVGC